MKLERRFFPAEVRAVDGEAPKIEGYVTRFGELSQVIYYFRERFAAGCFDACLALNPDVLGLFNHDMDHVLGRTTAGTMRLNVDSTGLAYSIDPPDTQLARDLLVSMRRKDIRGSSIGFYCLEDTWDLDENGQDIRTITKASVFDVSVVTDPAYLTSDSQVRSEIRAQMPQNDEALKRLVDERRAARALPATISIEERQRLNLLLQLADL